MKLCASVPAAGEAVVTLIFGEVKQSQILPPQATRNQRFNTTIADVAGAGDSGSGVFDLQRHCPVGIVSRKISETSVEQLSGRKRTQDIAKYFVPAPQIVAFLPDGVM